MKYLDRFLSKFPGSHPRETTKPTKPPATTPKTSGDLPGSPYKTYETPCTQSAGAGFVGFVGSSDQAFENLAALPDSGWVVWARSLPAPEWDAWRTRAKAIEAGLPRPGTIAAIEDSMRQAWREMTASAPVEATP